MTNPNIHDEMWNVARTVFSKAKVRARSPRLDKLDLQGLHGMRMLLLRNHDYDAALHVGLEITRREIDLARKDPSARAHAKAVSAMGALLRQVASTMNGASGSARRMIADLVEGIHSMPESLRKFIDKAPKAARPTHITAITGFSEAEWTAFVKRVVQSSRLREPSAAKVSPSDTVDLNVAARLSRMADRQLAIQYETPTYDLTDRKLRISRVTVSGFRGSAGTVTLDLTKNGKPADVLLWGDNGVGKSTLVDGLEFALQYRVDRSADFNSSLRSSVRNLTIPAAHAEVELSDGSVVTRSLVTNRAGRDTPSSTAVRPGFRIAPLVIRRADILRFLDTDALSRGTVFFDYFPDPKGTLGTRPDEQLRQLEEERFLLRVARDDLADQLAAIFPDAGADLANAGKLDAFLVNLLSNANGGDFGRPTDALPDGVREIVVELQSAQRRSSEIKKKLDQGVQTLNPTAYRSQLDRVVPILQTVTGDLTSSFKRISQASHIAAIRVLVAKSGPVSLDVVVEFDNGASALPQQAFSEGYKDLVALLFFLTVTKKAAEFGQAKVLILDDALQSVDSSIRVAVMDYVLDEFRDWQLIVTGHDRAWLAQLRGIFQRRGRSFVERNIARWSFSGGIEVSGASPTRAESLRAAISRADERMVAAGTGLLLEELAAELSWRLGASVIRREGDRYTLGDLWPGVSKALKATTLQDTVQGINARLDLRNLLGAHYNAWADSIPWSDIRRLGDDVLIAYNATYCVNCATWVEKAGAQIRCHCGSTMI